MLSDPEQVTSESTRGRLPSLKADPGKASAPGGGWRKCGQKKEYHRNVAMQKCNKQT